MMTLRAPVGGQHRPTGSRLTALGAPCRTCGFALLENNPPGGAHTDCDVPPERDWVAAHLLWRGGERGELWGRADDPIVKQAVDRYLDEWRLTRSGQLRLRGPLAGRTASSTAS